MTTIFKPFFNVNVVGLKICEKEGSDANKKYTKVSRIFNNIFILII
jgi:hypothetical protein